ncbi:MAG TPA: DsbE family thiol:disulfide interchange protein [Stellaceae bacterium]|nr:DsbE family thiol:disulfide interchange protein [Stellaceae bacterium]
MRRILTILPIVAFAALAGGLALGLGTQPDRLPSALIDQPVPVFGLPPLGAKPGLAQTDLGGRVILVNFFASWCAPCRLEQPALAQLAASGRVPVYGIDYKDKPEDALRWLTSLGDPYGRIGIDRDGRVAIDWGVYGVPETYLIDRAGRVRYRYAGPVTAQILTDEILPRIAALERS